MSLFDEQLLKRVASRHFERLQELPPARELLDDLASSEPHRELAQFCWLFGRQLAAHFNQHEGAAREFAAHLEEQTRGFVLRREPVLDEVQQCQEALRELYLLMVNRLLSRIEDFESQEQAIEEVLKIFCDTGEGVLKLLEEIGYQAESGYGFLGATDVQPPISAQYSAASQIDILRLEKHPVLEPVLDLGCGEEARLVEHLSSVGLEVKGLDRVAKKSRRLIRADWFDMHFATNQWGTIISHLGFSIHFINHHLNPAGRYEQYALLYMDILRSLKPGGRFCYTPGLPFVETHLPAERYKVSRYEVTAASELFQELRRRHSKLLGQDLFYAAHVVRR